jgi:hypothetical protein
MSTPAVMPDALEHWQQELQQIRAFAPYDPMTAWARAREVVAEIELAVPGGRERELAIERLLARARRASDAYRSQAERWNAEASAREEHFHRSERKRERLPLSALASS